MLDTTQPLVRIAAEARRPRDPWGVALRAAGELLVTGGVVVLLFLVYELYVTDLLNRGQQDALSSRLHAAWSAPAPAAGTPQAYPAGAAFAVLYVPRLGTGNRRVVLEGTAETELSQGPGHYVGTAMPGMRGNVSIAGHRVGKGSPFLDLDTVRPGDPIVVETRDSWFVYRVLGDRTTGSFTGDPSGIPGREVVSPSDLDAISPTPDAAASAPASGSYLTLTTCNPKFSARQRLVVHASLDATYAKSALPAGPPALTGR